MSNRGCVMLCDAIEPCTRRTLLTDSPEALFKEGSIQRRLGLEGFLVRGTPYMESHPIISTGLQTLQRVWNVRETHLSSSSHNLEKERPFGDWLTKPYARDYPRA